MRVLLGVDSSERGLETLENAIERAQAVGDEVTIAVYARSNDSLSEAKSVVQDRLSTIGVDPPIETLEGDPGSELVELAERKDYGQIVLSGGQVSPLGKISFTNVHEFVLLNAHTTVTLVR